MTSISVTDVDSQIGGVLRLELGKQWSNFEQFRTEGPVGIRQAIPEGTIGVLRLGAIEYVVLHRSDFNRLHGLASEVRRLSRGVVLIKEAVELVMKRPTEKLSLRHLKNLTMAFELPTTYPSAVGELEIDVEEGSVDDRWDLDPETYVPPRAARPPDKVGAAS